uniref:DNA-directed RNA polymerase n=1 Tax=Pithovirus LCPAC304 TaxID=2506594 RepID=A0A481ZBC4_9VIRU|nr:MAG: RNA polymerase domain protein [Pithovirus LCPAC304]
MDLETRDLETRDLETMDLEELSIVRETPSESEIKTVTDGVLNAITLLSERAFNEQKEKRKQEEADQDLQSTAENPTKPKRVSLSSDQVFEVLYELRALPRFWEVEDPTEINLALDILQTNLSMLQFPEGFEEKVVGDLEVGVFGLLFGLDRKTALEVYPVFKALNMANEYVVSPATTDALFAEESITMENLLAALQEIDVSSSAQSKLRTDNPSEYAKVLLYRFLLERIGDVRLPTESSDDRIAVSQELLEHFIPTDLLIDVGILTKGNEPQSKDSASYLTNFERARLIGHRATEISENAKIMTDPGDLTDPIKIAEKELRELVMPLKVCRNFPDGTKRIWCASSLAKARDEFYETLKKDLDIVSLKQLFELAISSGYASDAKELLMGILEDLGTNIIPEMETIRLLTESEQRFFVTEIVEMLTAAGISNKDMLEPVHVVTMLLPLLKTDARLHRLLVRDFVSNLFDMFSNVKWVNIPGHSQTDPKDIPRRLSNEEISDILSVVPTIRSAMKSHSDEARDSLVQKMFAVMQDIEMCPSSIPELKQLIIVEFNNSTIDPGSAVGINAADALGEQVSQMTLNSVVWDTEILISERHTEYLTTIVKIGEWIDTLMEEHCGEITLISKNNTEYLPLKDKVQVPTVSEDGKVFWSDVTAITRHLPEGDLVKIKTNSGRSVVATQSKSLLVWNHETKKLVQTNGSAVKIGDRVPIVKNFPSGIYQIADGKVVKDIVLDKIVDIERIPYDEPPFVYDLTVPSTTNFCLANGLGVADTFHAAGASTNMSSGIRALSELIYAMKTRKFPNCTIVFKERLSFDQILDKEADIVETMVGDLVLDWSIDTPDRMEQLWWHKYFTLPPEDDRTKVLRLQLNPILMVERKVTIKDVVMALKHGQGKDGIPSSSMFFAHSSTAEGILDIYPNPDLIKDPVAKIELEIKKGSIEQTSYREEYSADVFIDNIILPNLDNIRIRGVADIKEIYPVKATVLRVVAKEEKMVLADKERYALDRKTVFWKIYYDLNLISSSPIKPKYLLELYEALGYKVVHTDKNFAIITFKGTIEGPPIADEGPSTEGTSTEGTSIADIKGKSHVLPSRIAKDAIDLAKEAKKKKKRNEELPPRQKRLLDLENYMFLTTKGSSIVGLMEKAEVDPYYTYCNNIHLMALTLGVEAARQFFIKDLYDTITNQGGYVNPRNILLLADFLFRHGSFLGTNYTGMSAGTMGYFSLATFERSLQTLKKAAVFSQTETLEGVSAAIAVGKPVAIGTGFFEILSKPIFQTLQEEEEEKEEQMDLARQLEQLMMTGGEEGPSCPLGIGQAFELGQAFDTVGETERFLDGMGPKDPDAAEHLRVEEEPREPSEPSEVTEYVPEEECPTVEQIQGPSTLLREAVEDVGACPDIQNIDQEFIKVRTIEIPSDIHQVPLRPLRKLGVKKFGEDEPLPPSLVAELEDLEIEELGETARVLTVQFTDIPVIQLPKEK